MMVPSAVAETVVEIVLWRGQADEMPLCARRVSRTGERALSMYRPPAPPEHRARRRPRRAPLSPRV